MDAMREMTLAEYMAGLPKFHAANRELAELRAELARLRRRDLAFADLLVSEADELRDEQDEFVHTKYGWCYYTHAKPTPLIYNLFVHPEYRGLGKGKRLLKMAVFEIMSNGHVAGDTIQIEASPTEPGIDR